MEQNLRLKKAEQLSDFIKKEIEKKGMLNVEPHDNKSLNVSSEVFSIALYLLEKKGYPTYGGRVSINDQDKNIRVIGPPGTKHKDIFNFENVSQLGAYVS